MLTDKEEVPLFKFLVFFRFIQQIKLYSRWKRLNEHEDGIEAWLENDIRSSRRGAVVKESD